MRAYSLSRSKKLPAHRLIEVNDVKIPATPGSCFHGILCALAMYKNHFVPWGKIIELTQKYMVQYGGNVVWERFKNKKNSKFYTQRIKENTHTLTRSGRHCYGYRLHELGMSIYYFYDGAMLLTGGKLEKHGSTYDVIFPDGRHLQSKHQGSTMTAREFNKFFEMGIIDKSGNVLKADGITEARQAAAQESAEEIKTTNDQIEVTVLLKDRFDQNTAFRLEQMGLDVQSCNNNKISGVILRRNLCKLHADRDVSRVKIIRAI